MPRVVFDPKGETVLDRELVSGELATVRGPSKELRKGRVFDRDGYWWFEDLGLEGPIIRDPCGFWIVQHLSPRGSAAEAE